jgi:vacuolar protein sorting-associated protein 72
MTSLEKKKLPERSTRGKRLTELIEDEIEVDKKFYSQVFEDEENEEEKAEFEIGEEEEDAVDSDFDLEEDLTVITPQVDTKEMSTPKKNVYKDPLKSGKKKTTSSSIITSSSSSTQAKSTPKRKREEKDETKLRKSNRSNTVQASERLQYKLSIETPTSTRKKRKTEHKQLTQEDLLREASKTAQINTKSLENLIQMEEEKKKIPKNLKVQIEGPMIRLLSKNGVETITFTQSDIPTFIREKEDENRKSRGLCIVSGIEAKYVDPMTGVSYATVNAFKKIRECFEQFKLLFGDHATSPSYDDKMFLVNFHYFFHQKISSMTEMKEEEWKY